MTEQEGGWDDLWADPSPSPPPIETGIDWTKVSASLNEIVEPAQEPAPDSQGQPETGETSAQEESDGLTLFGDPDQFHVAWQHWKGMPEFHMDNLHPDSTLVVKFRTPEDREAFAKAIGREIRREEPRGIWYPNIVIAHFWDKRYRDASEAPVDNTPILSEADEGEDEADEIVEETA